MNRASVLLAIFLAALPAMAQASDLPVAINLPLAQGLEAGSFGLRITHRWIQPVRGGSKDAYGLDEHAHVGVGFDSHVPGVEGLNVQLFRSSDAKTVTLALQQRLWQGPAIKAALRVERFDQTVKDNPYTTLEEGILGAVVQAPVEWQASERLLIFAVPTWISRSNWKREPVLTVGLGARWDLNPSHGFAVEFYPRPQAVADLRVGLDQARLEPGWAVAYVHRTRGHRFTILGTNVPATTAHQVLSGDWGGTGPRPSGQWSLGFNLARLF